MRIDSFQLSHLILRFEQEKDMKPMHCVQNLAALRDLADAHIEIQGLKRDLAAVTELADSREGAMLLASDACREAQYQIEDLKRKMRQLLDYADHAHGCQSYTKGPCSCGYLPMLNSIYPPR